MTKKNKIKSETGAINPCYDILVMENNKQLMYKLSQKNNNKYLIELIFFQVLCILFLGCLFHLFLVFLPKSLLMLF